MYIPIDGIKGEITDKRTVKRLLNNPLLSFSGHFNTQTGELAGNEDKYSCSHLNLMFTYVVRSNRMFIKGSLHKYYNGGNHNYNDFSAQEYFHTIKKLEIKLSLLPKHIKLHYVEFGVNILLDRPCFDVLSSCILYGGKLFSRIYKNDHEEINCSSGDNEIKVYNKSLQHGIKGLNILRVEHKTRNFYRYCSKQAIGCTLEDLMQSNFVGLIDVFIKSWNRIVFFDPDLPENKKHNKMRNELFWLEKQKKPSGRQIISRLRNRLKEMNKRLGSNLQDEILTLCLDKIEELNNDVFTKYTLSYQCKMLTPKENKRCLLTNIDISMQREDSFLLSHTGLYHLQKHSPETYQRIKNKYLPSGWRSSDEEKQIKEIAHNIRSLYSYHSNKTQNLSQYSLAI